MTYIGQKGYTIYKECLDIDEQELIRKELYIKPFVPKSSLAKPVAFPIYRESKKKFYLPRFYGTKNYGTPNHIKIGNGTAINVTFHGTLRPHQKIAVQEYLKNAKTKGGGLLEIFCGGGKTCTALYIISALKLKSLIIVHKTFLMDQWKERIKEFLPAAEIGTIQGEVIDIENKDIVLGMLQSLSMKNYPYSIFKEFGLTVYDEVHHMSAEVFSRALFKIVTKHSLGLSATMKRKDGLTKVFKMFIGDVVYKKERENDEKVNVHCIKFYNSDSKYSKVYYNYKGHVHYARMISQLCAFIPRNEFILELLKELLKDIKNQQILILGHNKNLLTYLHDTIVSRAISTVGYYIGGMKKCDLKITETKKVIIATYKMAEEGLDIKTLTTLIMATPKTDIRQATGRILRIKDAHHLIIDIVDQHEIFRRQWKKRMRYYKKQKYIIKDINEQEPPPTHKLQKGICLID